MKHSRLSDTRTTDENSAIGYGVLEGKPYTAVNANMSTYNGAAALSSTVEDLFIWNEAFHNGKVLSNSYYADTITPHKFTNGFVPFVGYGLGFGIEDVGGQKTIGHPGGAKGYHADILRLPSENINIIFLSNVNKYEFKVEGRFVEKIIEIMYRSNKDES